MTDVIGKSLVGFFAHFDAENARSLKNKFPFGGQMVYQYDADINKIPPKKAALWRFYCGGEINK